MTGSVHLFPGQGDFAIGALLRATAAGPPLRHAARTVFDEIDETAVGRGLRPLRPWLFGDHPPTGKELARAPSGTVQLALFGASMSVHRALCARSGVPDAVLGVSFGEIAALTAAGVFTVADGAAIAHDLAGVLRTCPGGLTLLPCGEHAAQRLIDRSGAHDVVVACVNDDSETLVGGPAAQLERVEAQARRVQVDPVRLRLPFGAHHPSFTVQSRRFARLVGRYPVAAARLPVFSAVSGTRYGADEDLPQRLADCLIRPVRLPRVLGRLGTLRDARFHEAGTGSALSRSVERVLADRRPTVCAPLAEPGFGWEPRSAARVRAVPSARPYPATPSPHRPEAPRVR